MQGAVDVVAVVDYARETGTELAVRGGGHSSAGYSTVDGGIVLDFSRMRGVWVDPQAKVAYAQAGALWGDVDRETQAHGLAVPGGQISHTGIAGLTLGGGIGWLSRRHGLTIDNLLSVDLVTADGRLVTASESEHPDLFWGLRGGSGNFGVVVSFEYRLHEVGPLVLGGPLLYDLEDAPAALRNARDFFVDAPDEVSLWLVLTHVPSAAAVPGGALGHARCSPSSRSAPTSSAARRCSSRSRPSARRSPICTDRFPTPPSSRRSTTSIRTATATGSAATTSPASPTARSRRARRRRPHGRARSSPRSSSSPWEARSPACRPTRPRSETGRRRGRSGSPASGPTPPRTRSTATGRARFSASLAPWTTGAVYVNAIGGDVTEARKLAAFGGPAKYERLRELKRAWDPENLFHLNHNIAP